MFYVYDGVCCTEAQAYYLTMDIKSPAHMHNFTPVFPVPSHKLDTAGASYLVHPDHVVDLALWLLQESLVTRTWKIANQAC